MSDLIRYPCPSCGKSLKAPRAAGGKAARCSCGRSHTIPDVAEDGYGVAGEPTPRTPADLARVLVG